MIGQGTDPSLNRSVRVVAQMEVSAIGAATSFSLADVHFDEDKVKDGSQCNCIGMMTLLLVAAAGMLSSAKILRRPKAF